MTRRRLLIVEPHYDDAWLSLGGTLLLHPELHVTIVSVSEHPDFNPVDLTRRLVDRVESVRRTRALRLPDLGWDAGAVAARARAAGVAGGTELFLREAGLPSREALAEVLLAADPDAEAVLLPAGLFHPMHRALADLPVGRPVASYLEYPYRFYPSERARVTSLEAMTRHAIDVSEVAVEKAAIFDEVYPTQRYMLEREEHDVPLEGMLEESIVACEGWPFRGFFGGFTEARG